MKTNSATTDLWWTTLSSGEKDLIRALMRMVQGEAQRDCRSGPGGAEMGKRADLLFQVPAEESENEADLFAQLCAPSDETSR